DELPPARHADQPDPALRAALGALDHPVDRHAADLRRLPPARPQGLGMTGGSPWTRRALAAVGIAGLVFLAVPILIVIPMSFSSAKALTFPPPGFSLRWYEAFFGDARWMDAMWTSTLVA